MRGKKPKKLGKKSVPKKSRVPKRTQRKKVVRRPPLTTYHLRGSNRISIVFPTGIKTLDEIERLLIAFDWKPIVGQMQAHKKRNPLTKRMAYVPPKAFYVIFRLLKPKGVEQFFTTLSPPDMVVNLENIQDLTIAELNSLFESWQSAHEVMQSDDDEDNEAIEYMNKLDMRYLKEIIYHFIYNV